MAGELWQEIVQVGKEVTPGTLVPATRKMYTRDPSLTVDAASRPHEFAVGRRDRVRAHTTGPEEVAGQVMVPVSSDELPEWLGVTVQGGVTGITPVGGTLTRRYVYKVAGASLDALSLEKMDGAQVLKGAGVRGNQLTIAGSVTEQNEATIALYGQKLLPGPDDADLTMTAALTDRVPVFHEGWETVFGVGDFGDDPEGDIVYIDGSIINWNIQLQNNLERKYHGQNTKNSTGTSIGSPAITAQALCEAVNPETWAEFKRWRKGTYRIVRFVFGNNIVIEPGFNKFVAVDIPGAWTAVDLGQTDRGTRAYQLNMTYVTDPALDAGLIITCQTARTTLF